MDDALPSSLSQQRHWITNTLLSWLPDCHSLLSPSFVTLASFLLSSSESLSFICYLKGAIAQVSILSFFYLYTLSLFDFFYPSWLIYIKMLMDSQLLSLTCISNLNIQLTCPNAYLESHRPSFPFNKHLLIIYCVLGSLLGIENTVRKRLQVTYPSISHQSGTSSLKPVL